MRRTKFFSSFDFLLCFFVLLLTILGIFFIYSSGINSVGVSVSNEHKKQILFACLGAGLMAVFSFVDYRRLYQMSPRLYVGLIAVLIYTRLFGRTANGARSWIGVLDFGIQPSEFGKIVFILFLARFLESKNVMDERKRVCIALAIMLVPVGLILIQPDMGTASVYIPVFFAMCFAAKISARYLAFFLACGVLTVVFTVLPIWETDIYRKTIPFFRVFRETRFMFLLIMAISLVAILAVAGFAVFKTPYFYWTAYAALILILAFFGSIAFAKVLKPYQISRLIIFLAPEVDPLGSGWNIIQSKIAIGAGGFLGQGFLKGVQSHCRFLPQQSTDFIFSILSEEFGFVGGLFVFAFFAVIIVRALAIGYSSMNVYGYYVSVGIAAMICFHFVVNVGMVVGAMPITGIPLFFLSYGGSSLWTAMIAVGILMSINRRKLER